MNNNEMIRKINKSEKDIVKVNEQLDKKTTEINKFKDSLNTGDLTFKGCNFYLPYNSSEFGNMNYLIDKVKEVGCTHLTICIRLKMETKTSNTLTRETTDSELDACINYAMSKGLKIALKPHISGAGSGGWSNIQPTNISLWIASLRDNMSYYCAKYGDKIDIIFLSNECTTQTMTNKSDWVTYHNKIKSILPNVITTISTTMRELSTNIVYNIVDVCGVNLYIGIGGDLTTSQKQRNKNVFSNAIDKVNYIKIINDISTNLNKKFFITEFGCLNTVYSLTEPAMFDYGEHYVEDLRVQPIYYDTVLPQLMNNSNIIGINIWCANDGWTFIDKPSETTLKKYFGGV